MFDVISSKKMDGVTGLDGRQWAKRGFSNSSGYHDDFKRNKIEIAGKHAVVGRSAILGKPMAMMYTSQLRDDLSSFYQNLPSYEASRYYCGCSR